LRANYIVNNTVYSPDGIIFDVKTNIFTHPVFKRGWFEIQDEGSQLISYLTGAKPGMMIFDCCAGGGGKTLHLAALMKNKGVLYAADINCKRLENLRERARRAGADNIRIHQLSENSDNWLKRLAGKMDTVLIDAPCSGSGVFRRNPDAVWKLSKNSIISEFPEKQIALLDKYSRLIKTGGRLVYSTCSVASSENEQVIAKFLETHNNFQILDAGKILADNGINMNFPNGYLKLSPHSHNTDGFFGAVLYKSNCQRNLNIE